MGHWTLIKRHKTFLLLEILSSQREEGFKITTFEKFVVVVL